MSQKIGKVIREHIGGEDSGGQGFAMTMTVRTVSLATRLVFLFRVRVQRMIITEHLREF